MESDLKHASADAICATHLSTKFANHLKVSYNKPHFIAVKISLHLHYKLGCVAVHINLKRSTTTLKYSVVLSELYQSSPSHLLNIVCQFEGSCLTPHPFSAIYSTDCESCWIEWSDRHLTPQVQFDQNHHIKPSISPIAWQRSEFKCHQISSTKVSRTTPHSRIFIFPCSENTLMRA